MIPKTRLFNSEPGVPASRPVMEGEIEGVRTLARTVLPGTGFDSAPLANAGRVFLALGGGGVWNVGEKSWTSSGPALLAPDPQHAVAAKAQGSDPLLCLELHLVRNEDDERELAEAPGDRFPYFISYSECKTYREKIKSPKTVNRTLLPPRTFPRLCIGSVETDGPDHVAAHRHPMLEQYFVGMPDNDCRVRADENEIDFGPNEILHVPLGSSHSVDVAEGRHLHYIWIDVFKDTAGLAWIDEQHEEEPG